MAAVEDSNDETMDQQHVPQQKTEESEQIVKASDSLATREQIVPVLEEDFSISKETTIKEAKIEKRVVTKTKTVKVPIAYEELYINGKKLKSVDEPRILSALKDKISSIASSGKSNDDSVEQSISKKNKIENRGELVPLFSSYDEKSQSQSQSQSQSESESESEKIIPLYEEQIEIIKKVAKVAEIVITKRRITEKKLIDIDLKGEKVKVKYPDGRSESLS